jgi:hypothetical protein
VEADSGSSTEEADDAFQRYRTWPGPEDVNLSSYISAANGLALPTAAFPASMSCVIRAV